MEIERYALSDFHTIDVCLCVRKRNLYFYETNERTKDSYPHFFVQQFYFVFISLNYIPTEQPAPCENPEQTTEY